MGKATLQDLERDPRALLTRVESGESILLTREGRPVAELRPVAVVEKQARPYGLAAGEFEVPPDFDEPLPDEILRGFEGR